MSPNEASIAEEWVVSGDVIEVPGGKHCRVRRRPLTAFYKSGRIPNALMPKVRATLINGDSFSSDNFDHEELLGLIQMIDNVCIDTIEEPVVSAEPKCRNCEGTGKVDDEIGPKGKKTKVKVECPACNGRGEVERVPGKLYVDEIDFDVKNYIFNYVIGSTDDLASFRRQLERDVEPVPKRKTVARSPKRTTRAR